MNFNHGESFFDLDEHHVLVTVDSRMMESI